MKTVSLLMVLLVHVFIYILTLQTLADRIALPCTLTRGEYNRAWNEVMLTETTQQVYYKQAKLAFEIHSAVI